MTGVVRDVSALSQETSASRQVMDAMHQQIRREMVTRIEDVAVIRDVLAPDDPSTDASTQPSPGAVLAALDRS